MSDGSVPPIDDALFERPKPVKKTKTNLGRLALFVFLSLLAVSIMVASLWVFNKNRTKLKTKGNTSQLATSKINKEVNSVSIAKQQATMLAQERESVLAAKRRKEREAQQAEAHRLLAEQKKLAEQKAAQLRALEEQRQALEAARLRALQQRSQMRTSNNIVPKRHVLTAAERQLTGSVLYEIPSKQTAGQVKIANLANLANPASLANLVKPASLANTANLANTTVGGKAANTQQGVSDVFQASYAGHLQDLDYLLKKGTSIPCALVTAINTTLKGIVICRVVNDVYSANGITLLIERGATIFGEQTTELKQGQARAFVLWTRIDNPSGISLNVNSPATDQMGAAGVDGIVDTHFADRFGAAIMLSLLGDVTNYITVKEANSNNGDNSPTYSNTATTGKDIAATTLDNTINIPPTLEANNAKLINVLVAKDISFSNVYKLIE